MEQYIVLQFKTDAGEILSISIPNANPEATNAQVVEAMDNILATYAILSSQGEPVAIAAAKKITDEEESIAV
ncbi:MAG: DUF2922 domain-containing protein [Clostridiales bacterium]|jgi:hypothetical protein|nr:DUF2922 domain-containing protein [Clostridiales bacterium]